MSRCPNCSRSLEPDAKKCVNCGAIFDSMEAWKPIPDEVPVSKFRAPTLSAKMRGKSWVGMGGQILAYSISLCVALIPAIGVYVGLGLIFGPLALLLIWLVAFLALTVGLHAQEIVWIVLSGWFEEWTLELDAPAKKGSRSGKVSS